MQGQGNELRKRITGQPVRDLATGNHRRRRTAAVEDGAEVVEGRAAIAIMANAVVAVEEEGTLCQNPLCKR